MRVVIRSFSFHNFILGVVNIVREHNKLTNATIVNIENLTINNSDSRPLNSHENSARWIILVIIITFFLHGWTLCIVLKYCGPLSCRNHQAVRSLNGLRDSRSVFRVLR